MNPHEQALWRRVTDYSFDAEGATKTFADRLAKENGWSAVFAAGAIEEYRKFVFLSAATGKMVSPSEPVDQVWHLHLLYTRTYWETFCAKVLERPFHHEPATGAPSQQAQLHDASRFTMEQYRRYFGEPSAAYWPTRSRKIHKLLINPEAYLILPWRVAKAALFIVGLMLAAMIAFCMWRAMR